VVAAELKTSQQKKIKPLEAVMKEAGKFSE